MSFESTADVAIVGYGPTGQALALLLGRLGHSVVVIERWPDLYPLPRAVHFDHEVARIFQAAGVMADAAGITETVDTYQWRNADGQMLLELDTRGMGPSGWPIAHMFAQPELERVLDKHVKAQPNVEVRQGWSARSVTEIADGVRIEVERGEIGDGQWVATGEQGIVKARWLVGADGANSFVRQALGVKVHDLGFAFDWLVVDVKPRQQRDWKPKNCQLCDPRRPTTIVSGGPARRRWEFMALPGEQPAEMNRADAAWRLLAPWGMTPETADLERHAVYTFRGQWAEQWRVGRTLLAGDAALQEIANGGAASTPFWLTASGRADPKTSARLRHSLRQYCCRDTWAMVRLHQAPRPLTAVFQAGGDRQGAGAVRGHVEAR